MLFDLCIIGAGMFGSATARHASANTSLNVILVGPQEPKADEWCERNVFSSHYDEGRITCAVENNEVHNSLCQSSVARYRDLERLSGISFYHPVGFVCIGPDDELQEIKDAAATGKTPVLRLCNNGLLTQRFSFLKIKSHEEAYLHEYGSGYMSARKFIAAEQAVAKMQGCMFIHEVVVEVKPLEKCIYSNTGKSIAAHQVVTENGSVICSRRVIFCTGAFTNLSEVLCKLCERGQIPLPDITVFRETFVLLKIPVEEAKRLSSMPTMACCRADGLKEYHVGVYILPPIMYPDGNYYLKIGHENDDGGDEAETLQEVKEWYLSSGDPGIVDALSKIVKDILPGLSVLEVKGSNCVTCRNPSRIPYIDHMTPTVLVAAVGNGAGAMIADEIGRLAAELCVYGRWDSKHEKSLFNFIHKE